MELTGILASMKAILLGRRADNAAHRFLLAALLLATIVTSGCVISPRRIVGGATPTPTPGGSPTPTPAGAPEKLYISDANNNAILRFDNASTATGSTPSAVISGPPTTLNSPQQIFLDEANDRLYVANQGNGSVLVWDAVSTKSGQAAPTRSITGLTTNLVTPVAVAVDDGKDLLYVADGRNVFVFTNASTANGSPVFARDIQVNFIVAGMFLDATNDRLFLADSGANAINIYNSASTLTALVAPSRALTGPSTALNAPTGIAIDALRNLIVSNSGNNTVTIYANSAGVNNNQAPQVTLNGARTTLNLPQQIAVNKSTTVELFVANFGGANVPIFSNVLAASADVPPSRTIAPTVSGFSTVGIRGIALDTTR